MVVRDSVWGGGRGVGVGVGGEVVDEVCVQVCAGVCRCVQVCAGVCGCVQVCAGVCRGVWEEWRGGDPGAAGAIYRCGWVETGALHGPVRSGWAGCRWGLSCGAAELACGSASCMALRVRICTWLKRCSCLHVFVRHQGGASPASSPCLPYMSYTWRFSGSLRTS